MVFVDDLILFCGGDYYLTYMLFRGFVTFLEVLGFIVNKESLELYISNMDMEIVFRF